MPTLDTNVLVRFLVRDDPKQSSEADQYIAQFADFESLLFVPLTVALETEWVLRSRYGFPKTDVIDVFVSLLETREILFQDEASIERALFLYRENNIDFADCMHLASAYTHNHLPMVSFDKQATRIEGVERVR